jgi:hypothetical protein
MIGFSERVHLDLRRAGKASLKNPDTLRILAAAVLWGMAVARVITAN